MGDDLNNKDIWFQFKVTFFETLPKILYTRNAAMRRNQVFNASTKY